MEIESVVLVDGTKFFVGDTRFGGTVKRIYQANNVEAWAEVSIPKKNAKLIHIPYHSILFYVELEEK